VSRLAPLTRRKLRRTGAAGVSEDRTALFSDVGDKQVMVGVQNTLSSMMPQFPSVPLEIFVDHVKEMKEAGGFPQEYRHLEDSSSNHPVTVAKATENIPKNRYRNISAYDHTRVILQPTPGGSGQQTDYINANYISGYSKTNEYIAAQGPLTTTVEDFWRMVWWENTAIIVMVTNLYEMGRPKCAQYWPEVDPLLFGDLMVEAREVTMFPTYILRKFSLSNVSTGVKRGVVQYHFTSWPDFGVPLMPYDMLHFVRVVRSEMREEHGPLLIHCSAGVGRTGTYIAIDVILQHIQDHPSVCVQGVLQDLRNQRMKMVQSEEQYEFIHRAVVEGYLYKDTLVDSEHLEGYYHRLTADDDTELTNEFLRLPGVDPSEEFSVALHQQNRAKNRDYHRLPLDYCRVSIKENGDDYINASPILGYTRDMAYIITQHPLETTCEDFWKMVLSQKVNCIAMIGSIKDEKEQYWNLQNVESELVVSVEGVSDLPAYRELELTVSFEEGGYGPHSVKLFHFNKWNSSMLVTMVTDWLNFIESVENVAEAPIVIHSTPSLTQDNACGVYCAVSISLAQLQQEDRADVFQTVRDIRRQRPSALVSKDHYSFIYQCLVKWTDLQDTN
jgi:protein tyrosine phosphatase